MKMDNREVKPEDPAKNMLGKSPNPLNVYVWIKINDYQAIAILWKQKKIPTSTT